MKVYLAGPFFNVPQLNLIKSLENIMEQCEVPFFSPRLQHANKDVRINSVEQAQQVFKTNYENISDEHTEMLVAVLDWLMPEGQEIRILETYNTGREQGSRLSTKALHLPDTGTVWEMGYAYRHGIPILGFTTRSDTDALNLMLTQCCQGVCVGVDNFMSFMDNDEGSFGWQHTPAWKGKFK